MLDGRAQIVAEPEALADLLKEPRVRIGAHDLDRERQRDDRPRLARRGDQPDDVGLGQLPTAQVERSVAIVPDAWRAGARRVPVGGKGPAKCPSDPVRRHAADQREYHVPRHEVAADEGADGIAGHPPDAGDRAAHRVAERLAEEACPGAFVDVVAGVLEPAADLVDDDTLLLGEAIGGDRRVEALLGEERERLLDVVVEDLEVQRHVLVARVGIVLAAELAGAAVERGLVELARALKEHVLRHVGDAGVRAVEARAGAHRERDGGERARHGIVEHPERPVPEARGLTQPPAHTASPSTVSLIALVAAGR